MKPLVRLFIGIPSKENLIFVETIALIFISIFTSYTFYKLSDSKFIKRIFAFFGINTTLSVDELEEMIRDYEYGTWVIVYLKDCPWVYEASIIKRCMDTDSEKYICLTKYRKYLLDKNSRPQKKYICDFSDDDHEKERVLVYLKDIKLYEFCNTEQTTNSKA